MNKKQNNEVNMNKTINTKNEVNMNKNINTKNEVNMNEVNNNNEIIKNEKETFSKVCNTLKAMYGEYNAIYMILWAALVSMREKFSKPLAETIYVPVLQLTGDKGTGKTMGAEILSVMVGSAHNITMPVSLSILKDRMKGLNVDDKRNSILNIDMYNRHTFYVEKVIENAIEENWYKRMLPIVLTGKSYIYMLTERVITLLMAPVENDETYNEKCYAVEFFNSNKKIFAEFGSIVKLRGEGNGADFFSAIEMAKGFDHFSATDRREEITNLLVAYKMLPDYLSEIIYPEDKLISVMNCPEIWDEFPF